MREPATPDYYKLLGVNEQASRTTIRNAYKAAALKAHPDKNGGSDEAMQQVSI